MIIVKGRKGENLLFGGSAEQIPPAGETHGSNWLRKGIADKQSPALSQPVVPPNTYVLRGQPPADSQSSSSAWDNKRMWELWNQPSIGWKGYWPGYTAIPTVPFYRRTVEPAVFEKSVLQMMETIEDPDGTQTLEIMKKLFDQHDNTMTGYLQGEQFVKFLQAVTTHLCEMHNDNNKSSVVISHEMVRSYLCSCLYLDEEGNCAWEDVISRWKTWFQKRFPDVHASIFPSVPP